MELESSLTSIKCLGFVRMVCKNQAVQICCFSNSQSAGPSVRTVRLRAYIGKDRKEEKSDIFQYLTNPDERHDVLR